MKSSNTYSSFVWLFSFSLIILRYIPVPAYLTDKRQKKRALRHYWGGGVGRTGNTPYTPSTLLREWKSVQNPRTNLLIVHQNP